MTWVFIGLVGMLVLGALILLWPMVREAVRHFTDEDYGGRS